MNKININRLLLAGLAMFIMWIAVEILLEGVIADLIFGKSSGQMLAEEIEYPDWALFESFSPTTGDDLALIPDEMRAQLEDVQRVDRHRRADPAQRVAQFVVGEGAGILEVEAIIEDGARDGPERPDLRL